MGKIGGVPAYVTPTVPDESADLDDMESGVDNGPNFRKIGPFDSSCAY